MVERDAVVEALQTVHDPEIPVNVYDLGLVYDIEIENGTVAVEMTLTSPTCPIAGQIVAKAEQTVESVDGVESADVELIWEPPWSPEKATDAGKTQLQSYGISVGTTEPDDSDQSHPAHDESPF
ncbi:MAG: iron-sulfur cluster assembly protein [Halapricum sp.]